MKQDKEFFTTTEVAEILGISRIAVFKKIKKGEIKAQKFGRDYLVHKNELDNILGKNLSLEDKKIIDEAVKKTIKEYGKTLKLLGQE